MSKNRLFGEPDHVGAHFGSGFGIAGSEWQRAVQLNDIKAALGPTFALRQAQFDTLRQQLDPLGGALAGSAVNNLAKQLRSNGILNKFRASFTVKDIMEASSIEARLPRWATIADLAFEDAVGGRAQRWADQLNLAKSFADLVPAHKVSAAIGLEFAAIAQNASALKPFEDLRQSAIPTVENLRTRTAAFDQTLLKMSAFAGAIDTVGPLSLAANATFEALLGTWRTRPDLPDEFWRRPSVRDRFYREADVDQGLIDADNAEVVEVLIESGVVAGEVRGNTVSAVVEAGPLNVRISTAKPRIGAYRVITAFEIAMRGLVAKTLLAAQMTEGAEPTAWFKQRVPGDILKRARDRHSEAMRAGEVGSELVAFVDLGDLIPIMTSRANWPYFEPIFGSVEGFKVDMQRLNAWRRPTMHARPVSAVQLAEMTLIVNRMTRSIRLAGGWDSAWEKEH